MESHALGGIFHEFAQSGGTVAFYTVRSDGVYLGSLSGIVIGAIAGLILFAALPTNPTNPNFQLILVQSLLAGIGFKGVSEALGGNQNGGGAGTTVTITSPDNGASAVSQPVTITGAASGVSTVSISIDNGPTKTISVGGDGKWLFTAPTTLATGSHIATATAGTASSTIVFTA